MVGIAYPHAFPLSNDSCALSSPQNPLVAMADPLQPTGTGWIALIGAFLLVALVWSCVLLAPFVPLFSPHPLFQSLGVLAVTLAILILQPTWTAEEKVLGARLHAALQLLSFLLFAAGIAVIEVNKTKNHLPHFHSTHAYLGVTTSALLVVQYLFGFLIWAVPGVFGGIDNAKTLWKYHRWSGYAIYLLLVATVFTSTGTDYNKAVLEIPPWSAGLALALVVIGVLPRIHTRKLGLDRLLAWFRGETARST